jgi:hypothetical protein
MTAAILMNPVGSWSLKDQGRGKCLTVRSDKVTVRVDNCSLGTEQRWSMDSTGVMKNSKRGTCLDVNSSTKYVFANTCNGHINQKWSFSNSGDSRYPFRLYNKGQGYYMHTISNDTVRLDNIDDTPGFNWSRFQ